MRTRNLIVAVVAVVGLAAGGYGLYALGMESGMKMTTPDTGRQVLYWHDPMVPGQRFDKPGKSPFMDMQLVPVYAGQGGSEAGGVRIDPRVQQNSAYMAVIVLARVITKLGDLPDVDTKVIEGLYASDFDHLQRLYERINGSDDEAASTGDVELPSDVPHRNGNGASPKVFRTMGEA